MNIRFPQSRSLQVFAALAVIAALALAFVLLRGSPVEVHEVQAGPLVQTVLVTGRMANQSRVFLGSTITGRVREVKVREGARVKSGDLLVALEDGEQRAAAAQAEAAARSAEARLDSQKQVLGPVAAQQLAQARSTAETAARERERSESLFKRGFIGQARLDEVRRAADVAAAQLKAAEAQAESNLKGSELEGSVARVSEARAAAELARARLAQTRIVAPADALVLERLAEPGQIVQPGARLIELSIEGTVELIAQVDEKFLAQLAPGQKATVVADAFPGQPFPARVRSIAPSIDVQRGSVEVKFLLDAIPEFLRNDMTLSIEIETARREKTLAVPGEALRNGNQVLVIDGGRAVARNVKTGVRTLTAVEVVEGLQAGELVIVDAPVQPGARVRAGKKAAAGSGARSNLSTDIMKSFGRE
ncbi:MAG TPA: efflux RND transporter periplasmic adaptor subunit [Usitatibacteraceae bacterium]|nr:efflux RND transporter periplasmic adaptor subunit [Usitatibacteraceae bacterium]